MTAADIIILVITISVLGGITAFKIYKKIKGRKKEGCASCEGCPYSSACNTAREKADTIKEEVHK